MSVIIKDQDFDESVNRYKRLLVNNSVITDKELKNIDETLAVIVTEIKIKILF